MYGHAALGDLQVTDVFEGRDDGCADSGQVGGPAAGAAGGGVFAEVASRTWPFSLDDSHQTGAWQVRQAPKGHGFVFCGFKRT